MMGGSGNTKTTKKGSTCATLTTESLVPADSLAKSEKKPWLKALIKEEKAGWKRKTRNFKWYFTALLGNAFLLKKILK